MCNRSSSRLFRLLGPLAPTFVFMALSLFMLSLFRLALVITHWDRLFDTPEVWRIFTIGLRMDLVLMAYVFSVPVLFMMLLPKETVLKWRRLYTFIIVFIVLVLLYMEIVTPEFIEEYDLRPDRKFFEYLKHTNEVVGTLWANYAGQLIACLIAMLSVGIITTKYAKKLLSDYVPWSTTKRFLMFPIIAGVFILAARSTLKHRPVNISTAYFSDNHLANELALNSTYTVLYALYRNYYYEKNPSELYGKLSEEEVLVNMSKYANEPDTKYIEGPIPFLHEQVSPFSYDKPVNLVVVLLESVGASDTGCLGGPDLTPNICKLKDQGLWFTNLYATGTRTARAIESVVTGFLPTPSFSALKSSFARDNFFTTAELLKQNGYNTSFIYGGMSNFDDMRSFFLGNGFEDIYDEADYDNPVFKTTWGVSDEDLFGKANDVFKKMDKPFFSLILTTSDHTPYEFPDGRIELYQQPKNSHLNAVKYTDYAVGKFFEMAEKEDYYRNTIFLVVADHNAQIKGNDLIPIEKFHIPAFVIGPNVPQKTLDIIASQVDLMPTVLHFIGLKLKHPMIGRNLMTLPEGTIGRAIMQYSNDAAYRKGDDVVIMRPHTMPVQFKLIDGKLNPTELNPDMQKEALSHALIPWYLLSNRLYRID